MGKVRESVPWYHYTMADKPWFRAYCQTLPGNATIPDGGFLGDKAHGNWCGSKAVASEYGYLWWQVAKEALQSASNESNQCPDPLKEYSVEEELKQFSAGSGCTLVAKQFPQLDRWCNKGMK